MRRRGEVVPIHDILKLIGGEIGLMKKRNISFNAISSINGAPMFTIPHNPVDLYLRWKDSILQCSFFVYLYFSFRGFLFLPLLLYHRSLQLLLKKSIPFRLIKCPTNFVCLFWVLHIIVLKILNSLIFSKLPRPLSSSSSSFFTCYQQMNYVPIPLIEINVGQ